MGIKKSVFGSKSEERGFRSIQHQWGDKYGLYPQLPFSAIFEPDDTIHDTSNFFFKTSVDYCLCTQEGSPLMAIDFDGIGHGHNRNGQYISVRKTNDPYRKLKFDFKIRYAERYAFPYYVVSYDEFESLSESTHLTIVDGIIGYEMSDADFKNKIQDVVQEHQDIIYSLPPYARDDYVQDLVIGQELVSSWQNDPVSKAILEKMTELKSLGCEVRSFGYDSVEYPKAPVSREWPPSLDEFQSRLEALDTADWIGSVYTMQTSIGEVSQTAWMRNVGHWVQASLITKDMAELLAYERAIQLVKLQRKGRQGSN